MVVVLLQETNELHLVYESDELRSGPGESPSRKRPFSRREPVPNTGRRGKAIWRYRSPAHANLMRRCHCDEEEGEVPVRARISRRALSMCPWSEDSPMAAYRDRSWKRFRKTRWR